MNHKKWIFNVEKSQNIVEQILINRQIAKSEWQSFLNPDFESGSFDPFLINDVGKSVVRIELAIANKEHIGIFTDYDADGIPAGALLNEALSKLKLKSSTYIPNRQEGYGLNSKGIDYLKNQGATLIITADLGIRDIKQIEYANSLGLDVIITDHHEPGKILPEAFAIINPKLSRSKYPFRELSGGGVVFKLIQAISRKLKIISENDLKWMLDLVAITTICDMVPLISENRVFAYFGLKVLRKTRRLGLLKLFEAAGIGPKDVNTYTVGFQIGPRLNAPARLNQKQDSYNLLVASDPEIAQELATELDSINKRRQVELEKVLQEVRTRIFDQNLAKNKIICVWDKDWPSGLVGLVAGKITEEFSRPCIIFEKGEKYSKGSARSIGKFNIVEVLQELSELFENFGGHAKAAGLTIANNNLEIFYDRILAIADKKIGQEDLIGSIEIDAKLKVDNLSLTLFDQIKKLEPFGFGNARPVFFLEGIEPNNIRQIGGQKKHLKFSIGEIQVLAFDMGDLKDQIMNKKIDIVFSLAENVWQGKRELQLRLIDLNIKSSKLIGKALKEGTNG